MRPWTALSKRNWRDWPTGAKLRLLGRLRRHNARNAQAENLLEWAKRFFPHYFTLPPSRMHRWLARRLVSLERGQRLAVIAPRDSAKSTWLSFLFPLFCALHGRERYILLVAETVEQARRYLRAIKQEIERNAALRAAYPEAAAPGDQWTVDRITLRNGVELEALGTGKSIRGRKSAAVRPTLVVVDDPQDRKHITSATYRQHDWTWFTQDLLNVGSPETIYLVAGTSLHRDALVDRLMRQPGWITRRFAAVEQWPSNMWLWQQWEGIYTEVNNPHRARDARAFYEQHRREMDAGAVVCWPEREDLYTLMRLRVDIGRTAFEAEKQGNPINPELCEWPEAYFEDHIWFDRWPDELLVRVLALDPSKGSDSRVGDYSAVVLLGVDAHGVLYCEADLDRRPVEQIVQQTVDHYQRFQPDVFGCEANAWQDLLAADFQAEFQRRGLLAARPVPLTNREPKVVRIRRLGPWLSQRRVRFKSKSRGTALLVDQLKDFPLGDHDDGPDALEMALRLATAWLQSPGGEQPAGRLVVE